jgi:hypothetical protein
VAYFSERLHGKPTENSSSSWPKIMKKIEQIFIAQLFQLASTKQKLIANCHLDEHFWIIVHQKVTIISLYKMKILGFQSFIQIMVD